MLNAAVNGVLAALAAALVLLLCYLVPNVLIARRRNGGGHLQGWIFVGPLVVIMALLVVAPTIRTAYLSFFDKTGDEFVGLSNWSWAVTSETARSALRNNALWVVGVTAFTMTIGFIVALGSDMFKRPSFVRAAIFAPMAISAVGATIIWQLVYAFRPAGSSQVGLLNELVVLAGREPRAWLVNEPTNTWFLIWIMIWMWTGFATVVFSAALRTVPADQIEAAQLDGAKPLQTLWYIVLPAIRTTTTVILVATVVTVLKVFDIVRVATNGQFGTNVLANEMINQAISRRDTGRASALAILLLVIIVPFMAYNAYRIRQDRLAS